jgi:hypothetical protein
MLIGTGGGFMGMFVCLDAREELDRFPLASRCSIYFFSCVNRGSLRGMYQRVSDSAGVASASSAYGTVIASDG